MSTFMNPPCCWLPDSTDAENEIRRIFFEHWEKMKNQMLVTVNEINAWRQKFIEYINAYADEQMRNLAADYDRQRLSLDEKREENLDTTRACYGAQNFELFNELRNACRLLQFQVAQLESVTGPMSAYRVITVQEQMERKKKEQSDTPKAENDKSDAQPTLAHTSNMQDSRSENRDVSVKLVSPVSNETHPHSSVVESSNNNSRSTDHSNDSQTHTPNTDEPMNKCPICFMIFPLTMKQDDRSQHVNEHCTDD